MCDLKHKTYVILEFGAVDGFRDSVNKVFVRPNREEIVEVAAVKIVKGKIQGHFHSFVAIDGYDAHNIDFEDCRNSCFYAQADHLIDAPSFNEVAERLQSYVEDSVLVIRSSSLLSGELFNVFKEKAQSIGILFNNRTVNISCVYTALNLKKSIAECGKKFEEINILQLAQILKGDERKWSEIFTDHDIFFDPDSEEVFDKGRNDPLSWALAFARLFIALNNHDEEQRIDEKADFPF